jgi:hypothetical protein
VIAIVVLLTHLQSSSLEPSLRSQTLHHVHLNELDLYGIELKTLGSITPSTADRIREQTVFKEHVMLCFEFDGYYNMIPDFGTRGTTFVYLPCLLYQIPRIKTSRKRIEMEKVSRKAF